MIHLKEKGDNVRCTIWIGGWPGAEHFGRSSRTCLGCLGRAGQSSNLAKPQPQTRGRAWSQPEDKTSRERKPFPLLSASTCITNTYSPYYVQLWAALVNLQQLTWMDEGKSQRQVDQETGNPACWISHPCKW